MLKSRIRRQAAASTNAAIRLAQIEASIVALKNEDLLDLADIVKNDASTPLMEIAAQEVANRAISL